MTALSGTEFNEKYPNPKLYTILTKDYKHFDFTYQRGLNIHHILFNPYLPFWISNVATSIYIAKVTIAFKCE